MILKLIWTPETSGTMQSFIFCIQTRRSTHIFPLCIERVLCACCNFCITFCTFTLTLPRYELLSHSFRIGYEHVGCGSRSAFSHPEMCFLIVDLIWTIMSSKVDKLSDCETVVCGPGQDPYLYLSLRKPWLIQNLWENNYSTIIINCHTDISELWNQTLLDCGQRSYFPRDWQ